MKRCQRPMPMFYTFVKVALVAAAVGAAACSAEVKTPAPSAPARCDDGVANGGEGDVDCGGPCPTSCPIGATCAAPTDCASGACSLGTCAEPSCTDAAANGRETGVDCGGPECGPCATGAECTLPSDCVSRICSGGACVAATCTDGVKNGAEAGVDCGAGCALRCPEGTDCSTAADCATSVCQAGVCRASGCGNATRDSDETDIDCGGFACAPCAAGDDCALHTDCVSRVCTAGVCQAPTCSDAVRNQQETDVDCAGECAACSDGAACRQAGDCQSGACAQGLCEPATCRDGSKNGSETDVDCGGPCAPCAPGAACVGPGDCASDVCTASVCAAPTCTDGVKNGAETGIDCGALACVGDCGAGLGCTSDYDCASRACDLDARVCSAPSCTDGRANGGETDTDCGGPCGPCATGNQCSAAGDCASGVCTGGTCAAPTCSDGTHNGDETAVDCGGSCVAQSKTCANGSACNAAGDCGSGICLTGICAAAHCQNGTQDANETGLNCGGPECPPCGTGQGCSTQSDCQSGVCTGNLCAAPSCFDGVQNGSEQGLDCGGDCSAGCATGSPCSAGDDCASGVCITERCQAARCGDGVKNAAETCDGADLGAATCVTQGFLGGTLGCSATCTAFETSACVNECGGCPGGQVCIDDLCQCGAFQTFCGGQCVTTATDPRHCGACGNDCVAQSKVCSAGQCTATCLPPLVACGGRCVDPTTDNAACGGCPGAGGTACTGGTVCSSGSCSLGRAATPMSKCEDGGPPIVLNTGGSTPVPPSQSCTGDLAAVSFRWAMCSCTDISTKPVFTDSYDSDEGPYSPICEGTGVDSVAAVPCTTHGACSGVGSDVDGDGQRTCADELGAGVGANGVYFSNQLSRIWGTLWWENASPTSTISSATVRQDLQCGGVLPGTVHVGGDAYVAGNVTASGTIGDDLFTSASSSTTPVTNGNLVLGGSLDKTAAPLDIREPCDCASTELVNVVGIVDAHACAASGTGVGKCSSTQAVNDNFAANISPDLFNEDVAGGGSGGRLDLDCGLFFLSQIKDGNDPITIHVSGRAALFIDGNIDAATLVLQLGPAAELDVFVKGSVCVKNFRYGSPNFPARARIYIGGGSGGASGAGGSGDGCSGGGATPDDAVYMPQSATIAGNMYAPWGTFDISQDLLMYGGLFVGRYDTPQSTTIHFDTAVANAPRSCSECGDGVVDAGEQCDGAALGGKTCTSVAGGFTGGVLSCTNQCVLDTSKCFSCGNGTRETTEQCDPGDTGDGVPPPDFGTSPVTCQDLGFDGGTITTCTATCTVDPSQCTRATVCGDGTRDGTEECDPGDPGDGVPPPSFGASPITCQAKGFDGGTITSCNSNCTVDTGGCYRCGDGTKNGAEECDGADLGTATCQSQGQAAGTLACTAACTFDYSGCGGCSSCRDCNNQACNNGSCSGGCGRCSGGPTSGAACEFDEQCGAGGTCVDDSSACCAPYFCFLGACIIN